MRRKLKSGLTTRILETSLRAGFRKAYDTVRVNPDQYLAHLKRVHQLPISSWKDMQRIDERTLNPIAARVISASTKTAALEGMVSVWADSLRSSRTWESSRQLLCECCRSSA